FNTSAGNLVKEILLKLNLPDHKSIPMDSKEYVKMVMEVRISQKSQENSQKRASTDTRIRRVQKEAKESKPKPGKSSLGQIQSIIGQQKIKRIGEQGKRLEGSKAAYK
ncbi:hypothetical protein Tco_1186997, partial [Tanacetum coccineum]